MSLATYVFTSSDVHPSGQCRRPSRSASSTGRQWSRHRGFDLDPVLGPSILRALQPALRQRCGPVRVSRLLICWFAILGAQSDALTEFFQLLRRDSLTFPDSEHSPTARNYFPWPLASSVDLKYCLNLQPLSSYLCWISYISHLPSYFVVHLVYSLHFIVVLLSYRSLFIVNFAISCNLLLS